MPRRGSSAFAMDQSLRVGQRNQHQCIPTRTFSSGASNAAQAASREVDATLTGARARSVSRVRVIRTHGLNGGLAKARRRTGEG